MRTGLSSIILCIVCLSAGCQTVDRQTRSKVREAVQALQRSINDRSFETLQPYLAREVSVGGLPPEMSMDGLKAGMLWTPWKIGYIEIFSLHRTPDGSEARVVLYLKRGALEQRIGFNSEGRITSINADSMGKSPEARTPAVFTSNFSVHGKLMFVEATVNGKTGHFLFDTGASSLLLNQKYFRPEAEDGMAGISASVAGLKSMLGHTKVKSLQWGDLRIRDIDGELHDFSKIEESNVAPLLGAISYNEVKNCAIVMDWKRKTIQVFATKSNGSKKSSSSPPPNGISFPFHYDGHLPVVDARIGGKSYSLLFDSGAEINLLPDTFEGMIHFRQVGQITIHDGGQNQSLPVALGIVDETVIADHSFSNLPFAIRSTPYLTNKGFLGTSFLAQVERMEINFREKRITLWR